MDDLNREPGRLDTDDIEVRVLRRDDLDWVVRIDQQHSGRARRGYYELKLEEAENDTGVRVSLAAFVSQEPAGFLTGRLYYGEFGHPEPVAMLDSMGVAGQFAGRKVGKALLRQLVTNLRGLGIEKIETQVDWDQLELLGFFQHAGFRLAPRLCLELDIDIVR